MIKRESFLIHRIPTITEVYKLKNLLGQIDRILERAEINDKRITNEEMVHLQILWESVQEMPKNEDLENMFYFDIEKARKKLKQYLGG